MNRFLPVVLLIIFAAGISIGSRTPFLIQDEAAVITFEAELIDFGTVQQGSEQVRTFEFTNAGKSPLVISAIKGQCGCTTIPNWSKEPIEPGGKGSFQVKYDTSIRTGLFDKKIMVYSNASNCANGFSEVKIKGNVVPAGK
ncbi:MAG TPA: DUF1573 domain-containing protein [Bacteroidia bacterium]|nr:DUF1573 domain-containing protein [Bacteroidia bacterium]